MTLDFAQLPTLTRAYASSETTRDHTLALSRIARFIPVNDQQRAWMGEALDLAGRRIGLGRELPVHFTASAMIAHPGTGQVLLVWHESFAQWMHIGGHADGDGDLSRVVVREVAEETGLDGLLLDRRPVDFGRHAHGGDSAGGPHAHLDVRFLLIDDDRNPPAEPTSPEGLTLRWCSLSDLCADLPEDHDVGSFAHAAAARLRTLRAAAGGQR